MLLCMWNVLALCKAPVLLFRSEQRTSCMVWSTQCTV